MDKKLQDMENKRLPFSNEKNFRFVNNLNPQENSEFKT